jgi:hypothetical protein
MRYQFDARMLQYIGDRAGVSNFVISALFVGDPVQRGDAEKVLVVLSEVADQTWNLHNTTVPLVPEKEKHHE